MNPSQSPAGTTPAPVTAACALVAHAVVRLPAAAVEEFRRPPGPACGEPLPSSTLKHAEEQTITALVALAEAIRSGGLAPGGPAPFADWGVLAAPRYLGRSAVSASVARFHAEGAWGVSPHFIPNRTLHSVSGTVSQALCCHGPNAGVGGGPGGEAEGLFAALALLGTTSLPGLWLLFTRVDPELPCGETAKPHPDSFCEAIALALQPQGAGFAPVRLELTAGLADAAEAPRFDFSTLVGLLAALDRQASVTAPVAPGCCLRLRRVAVPLPRPHLGRPAPRSKRRSHS